MNYDLLERICGVAGVSGYEEAAQELVVEELRPLCDKVYTDRMNNVIGVKRATNQIKDGRPLRVVFAAHVDEYGYVVRNIDSRGFISISPISGSDVAMLMSQPLIIYGKEEVRGVAAPKNSKDLRLSDIRIDTGRSKEWVEERVSVGDLATIDAQLSTLNEKTVISRNFDDRAGTYCLIEAAKRINNPDVDIYFVSSVQEEVGIRGMPVAASVIDADVGLAIDGGVCNNAYESDKHCDLGTGVAIYQMDTRTLSPKPLVDFLCKTCDDNKIPYRKTIDGGTDAEAIQRTGSGAWSTTIGAPTRYMHSSVQMCNTDDLEATIQLLHAFCDNVQKLVTSVVPWQEA